MKRKLLKSFLVTALVLGICSWLTIGMAAAPKEIVIGSCSSLTGPMAGFGEGSVFGVQAAVDDINKLGGIFIKEYGKKIPVKHVIVDNESDENKAASLAQDLILRDKVKFIVNGISPANVRAPIANVCERFKVIQITGVGPMESWLSLRDSIEKPWGYTWTPSFAIATPAEEGDFRHGKLGFTMLDSWMQALDELGDKTNKRFAAFATDDSDSRGWYMFFSKIVKEKGWDVYRVNDEFGLVPTNTTDFSSLIREWKKNDCEVLWANCPAPVFGAMWRQARMMGFKPKMAYATKGGLFYSDIKTWGGDIPHAVSNEMFWNPSIQNCPGIGDTTPMSLHERWVKKTGQPLHQNVGMGYQCVQVMIDAVERAGSLDTEKLLKALKETDLMTVYYRVVFDKNNFSRNPVSYGQWVKTDKPHVWENPVVLSHHDFLPATQKLIFPIPY